MNRLGTKRSGLLLCGILTWGIFCLKAQGSDIPLALDPVPLMIQEGAYEQALDLLEQGVPERDPYFYHFQRAYCLQRLERWGEAAALYEALLKDSSPIDDYVLFYLAECYAQQELWMSTEERVRELVGGRGRTLEDEARELLALTMLRSGRAAEAIEAFQHLAGRAVLKARRPVFWLHMAWAHQQAGRDQRAAQLFADILSGYPASPQAEQALEALEAIRQVPLSGDELFDSAWVHYHRRRYRQAAAEWNRFSRTASDPDGAAEALFLSAKASYRGKSYSKAEETCRQLLRDHPQSQKVTSAHYYLARIAEGDGRDSLAQSRFRQFATDYSWSQLADDAHWRLAQALERSGDFEAAQGEYLILSDLFASRERGWEALRKAGLLSFLLGDVDRAAGLFERFRTRYASISWARGAMYWEARAHMSAGRQGAGGVLLEELIARDQTGYYGHRARARLGWAVGEGGSDQDPDLFHLLGQALNDSSTSEEAKPAYYRRGKLLLRLGLLPQAREELHRLPASPRQDAQVLLDLLTLYEQLELAGDALRLALRMEKQVRAPGWEEALEFLLYPLGYQKIVSTMAGEYDLEANLLFSVIRTESHFDPLAVSPAGARGLMQIMPATEGEIAEQLGFSGGVSPSPFRPQWNIRLGSYYLRRQLEDFDGQPERALAAYNAGPGNVRRWLRQWGVEIDPELFVELIDFNETRNFVRKVLSTQARYRRIWGEQGSSRAGVLCVGLCAGIGRIGNRPGRSSDDPRLSDLRAHLGYSQGHLRSSLSVRRLEDEI